MKRILQPAIHISGNGNKKLYILQRRTIDTYSYGEAGRLQGVLSRRMRNLRRDSYVEYRDFVP
jgi:hypothetical protein